MEGDENADGVLEDRRATEEPRLAQENCENTVVHGVTGVAIQTTDNEVTRRIDGCQCALPSNEEVPDATKEDAETDEREDARGGGGDTEFGQLNGA